MRQQFIQADSIETAREEAPWAAEIVAVEGGFHAFESLDDLRIWENQK